MDDHSAHVARYELECYANCMMVLMTDGDYSASPLGRYRDTLEAMGYKRGVPLSVARASELKMRGESNGAD